MQKKASCVARFFIGWEVLYKKLCFDFVCQLHMDWVWPLSINA